MTPRLLTIKNAAERVGVCKTFIYALLTAGEIRAKKLKAGGTRVVVESLDAWADRLPDYQPKPPLATAEGPRPNRTGTNTGA